MKRINMIILILMISLVSACTNSSFTNTDLTTWNDDEVFDFLNEVKEHILEIPIETYSAEEVIKEYALYFSEELSEKIVNSLYVKDEDKWMIPDGDAGYIFSVPGNVNNGGDVTIRYYQEYIEIKESFKAGMYKEIKYTIEYKEKPIITEWIQVYD